MKITNHDWEHWNTFRGTTLRSWRIGVRDPNTNIVHTIATINNELPGDTQVEAAKLIQAVPELIHLLYQAKCYVEDAIDDPAYKKGVVAKLDRQITALLNRL